MLILGCFWINFRKLRPVAGYGGRDNVEDFPMVLVQIPMCKEREVSKCRFLILETFISLVTLLLGGLISYQYKFI